MEIFEEMRVLEGPLGKQQRMPSGRAPWSLAAIVLVLLLFELAAD